MPLRYITSHSAAALSSPHDSTAGPHIVLDLPTLPFSPMPHLCQVIASPSITGALRIDYTVVGGRFCEMAVFSALLLGYRHAKHQYSACNLLYLYISIFFNIFKLFENIDFNI